MSDIQKHTPMPPDLLAGAMPVQVPQILWQNDLVSNFFHNWKLKQIELASEREANIAEHKCRMARAYLGLMQEVTTYSSRLKEAFRTIDHNIRMMDLAEAKEHELYKQETWKTKTMEVEFLTAEITYKKMKQEVEVDNTP